MITKTLKNIICLIVLNAVLVLGFARATFHWCITIVRKKQKSNICAKKLRKPIKWTADRADHFMGDAQGRDNVTTARMALAEDGKCGHVGRARLELHAPGGVRQIVRVPAWGARILRADGSRSVSHLRPPARGRVRRLRRSSRRARERL